MRIFLNTEKRLFPLQNPGTLWQLERVRDELFKLFKEDSMSYYKDFREYLKVLEKNDKLIRIKREINKETELHPLVRLQYRGLPEEDRKAFLFENVIDSKGKKYNIPVTVAWCAGSKYIYALGMNC